MGIIEYSNIQEKVRKLNESISPRGRLELLTEESSEVIQASMKLIRASEVDNKGTYPIDKEKYNLRECTDNLVEEIMDVVTCIYILCAESCDVRDALLGYDVISERLDKMLARIEENKNE